MLIYLVKLTVIWAVFLVLYELLYAGNKNFSANRIVLISALLLGIILPLIHINIGNSAIANTTTNAIAQINNATPAANNISETNHVKAGFNWLQILYGLYAVGVLLFLFITIKEILTILRKAIYGQYQTIQGYKVFTTGKIHAPFSFMGWVFISKQHNYNQEQLAFILQHEAAHNHRLHWVDLFLMQLITIACWFHPLVWRYKRDLRLLHEYEADSSIGNTYDYGQFLLQETLLGGTPAIAHSFHSSPIKKRITMLTKNQKRKTRWKYLFLIPLVCCTTILLAQSHKREQKGNITTFMGNEFEWNQPYTVVDTVDLMTDLESGKSKRTPWKRTVGPQIIKYNGENVIAKEGINHVKGGSINYVSQRVNFNNYLKEKFIKEIPDYSKNISEIQINNVMLDKNGKIKYFDIEIHPIRPFNKDEPPFISKEEEKRYEDVVENLVLNAPPIAMDDNNANVFLDYFSYIKLGDFSAHIKAIKL